MRKIFQYSALFYFVLATQCQSMDSGATIAAVEPSSFSGETIAIESPPMVGENPATWSPKSDATAEPRIHIDPVVENTVFPTKEDSMMYTTQVKPAIDQNVFAPTSETDVFSTTAESMKYKDALAPTSDTNVFSTTEQLMEYDTQVDPIPMEMMMRCATPLAMVKRTATAAPKAVKTTKAAAKTTTALKMATVKPTVTSTAKTVKAEAKIIKAAAKVTNAPKSQAKPITFMKSNKLIGF